MRVKPDCFREIGDRPVEIPFGLQGIAAVGPECVITRIERQRLAEVVNGSQIIFLAVPGAAALLKSLAVLRISLNDLVEIGNGLVVALGFEKGSAPVVEILRPFGISADDLVEIGDCLLMLPLEGKLASSVVVGGEVFRI